MIDIQFDLFNLQVQMIFLQCMKECVLKLFSTGRCARVPFTSAGFPASIKWNLMRHTVFTILSSQKLSK